MKGRLILEDGTIFEGKVFGHIEDSVGEVVFNTSMAGYQEILTDPSYYGQIVAITYPLVGNYGINLEDKESSSVKVSGFIIREKSDMPSNFRCEMDIDTYLKQSKVIGLEGIDTRALTKIIRNKGTMKGIITTEHSKLKNIQSKLDSYDNSDAVKIVSRKKIEHIKGKGKKVAIIDLGVKDSIIKGFVDRGCDVTIFPVETPVAEILSINPDLICVSNGPGNPMDLQEESKKLKEFIGKKPLIGISLGHQLIAMALGSKIDKLKYGHRGANHPVKNFDLEKIFITSQNHSYYVSETPKDLMITDIHLNDKTIEGIRHNSLSIYSVQYDPNEYVFDKFMELAE